MVVLESLDHSCTSTLCSLRIARFIRDSSFSHTDKLQSTCHTHVYIYSLWKCRPDSGSPRSFSNRHPAQLELRSGTIVSVLMYLQTY